MEYFDESGIAPRDLGPELDKTLMKKNTNYILPINIQTEELDPPGDPLAKG